MFVYGEELIEDPVDPCQGNEKCKIIETNTWDGKIIEEIEGDFDTDAPIPTIVYVSPAGLVTISWDREM